MVKIVLLVILSFLTVLGQESGPEEQTRRFRSGVNLYDEGNYTRAYTVFTELASGKDLFLKTRSEVFLGKILLQTGKLDEAGNLFKRLSGSVTDTSLLPEIILNKAIVSYRKSDYYQAAEDLVELLRNYTNKEYRNYAQAALDTLSVNHLSSADLEVLTDFAGKKNNAYMLFLTGKLYMKEGNKTSADPLFRKIMRQYSGTAEARLAEDFIYGRRTIKSSRQSGPVIAVLFPPDDGGATNEIKEGIKFAVYEFNLQKDDSIGLVFLDFDRAKAEDIKNSLYNMDVKCLLGPIYSDDVRFILTQLKGAKFPLISPTATDNDLTGYNEFFFQANPNFTNRARAMAQYIYYVENKRKIGVLNSIEGYSPLLAASFTKEFRDLGGEVIKSQTYRSRSGSLDEPVSAFADPGLNLEGIYVPVSDKDDINPILTAFSGNNMTFPLYGNQDWFLGKGFESYPGLMDGFIFESDYFIDYNNFAYSEFSGEFSSVTGIEAGRNVLYGYDITHYFLNQLTKISADPEIIARRMMNGNTVTGYHNNICFDEGRVNKYVNIIRFRSGVFELVDKYKINR